MDSPSHTVLVVDDDASIRFLCRVNMELDGWTVRDAATLDQARAELADGEVAVVLLDVHVGSENGIDFLAELRDTHPRLPVAMLTGSFDSRTPARIPADAVIPKPFTLEQLRKTVGELAPRPAFRAG